jgi:hypothetical protein
MEKEQYNRAKEIHYQLGKLKKCIFNIRNLNNQSILIDAHIAREIALDKHLEDIIENLQIEFGNL